MSYPKVCLNCDSPFEAKRDSARFCGERCKNDWHSENRAASVETVPQRVERHVLDEVRGLLEEHKGDWTLIVREYARRTLLATGYLSAADFTILGVPVEHCNLPGAQIGAFAGAGYMEAISFKRWSAEAKASRKSGKYWVYRVTTKGKEKLSPLVGLSNGSSGHVAPVAQSDEEQQGPIVGLDVGNPEGSAGGDSPARSQPAPSTGRDRIPGGRTRGAGSASDVQPGEGPTEVDTPQRHVGASPPVGAEADLVSSPDSLVQLKVARKAPSAYDPWEGEAA